MVFYVVWVEQGCITIKPIYFVYSKTTQCRASRGKQNGTVWGGGHGIWGRYWGVVQYLNKKGERMVARYSGGHGYSVGRYGVRTLGRKTLGRETLGS